MRPAGIPQTLERRRQGAAARANDIQLRGGVFVPPPARLRAPPSRRLPLKGGVILERLMQASYHSPLEGESQKPSRQAKADAVAGEPSRKTAARGHAR